MHKSTLTTLKNGNLSSYNNQLAPVEPSNHNSRNHTQFQIGSLKDPILYGTYEKHKKSGDAN